MTIGKQLHCVVMLLILLCAGCSGNDADQPRRPNILLILADDLGVNDIGSWGDGEVSTPTLDELSNQSIRFRHFYTDSTCSVSRAALLTGRAPASIGFNPDGLGLSPDLATLPKSLKTLGYRTHHIGKWHVGEAFEYPDTWPLRQGFDYWFGMYNHFRLHGPEPDGSWIRKSATYINPWLQENDEPARQYQGHLDDLLTDRAVSVIKHSADGEPWFMNLWLLAPHHPFEPSESFKQQFPDTVQGHYLALLKQMDSNVGRVIEALKSSDQWDNTIVIFASDNGSHNIARDSNWPLLGTKNTYKEGGVRAPLLIHWPGHSNNRDVKTITQITDLYPTLLGMIGSNPPPGLNGVNLSRVAEGDEQLAERKLFWAADVKGWGMTYAGHLPRIGGFYRDLYGGLENLSVTGALPQEKASNNSYPFSVAQTSELIRGWERAVRPIPLEWHEAKIGQSAYLIGRDYQRTPAFGSYSLGLALVPEGTEKRRQTLIEQPGVWKLELDELNQLRLQHGVNRFQGPKVQWASGCNRLVVSLNIQPAAAHPYPVEAASVLTLYLNGASVFSSTHVLSRPASGELLAQPTYIGGDAVGENSFAGHIDKPVLVGKYLQPKQEGYSLVDMDESLCPALGVALQ